MRSALETCASEASAMFLVYKYTQHGTPFHLLPKAFTRNSTLKIVSEGIRKGNNNKKEQ